MANVIFGADRGSNAAPLHSPARDERLGVVSVRTVDIARAKLFAIHGAVTLAMVHGERLRLVIENDGDRLILVLDREVRSGSSSRCWSGCNRAARAQRLRRQVAAAGLWPARSRRLQLWGRTIDDPFRSSLIAQRHRWDRAAPPCAQGSSRKRHRRPRRRRSRRRWVSSTVTLGQ
jgi:hypothetical protein